MLAEVVGDLGADPLLGAGGGEAEVGQILRRQPLGLGQCRGVLVAQAVAQALHRQLMGQQFLEGQAVLRPMPAFGQLVEVGIRRRPVQVAQGLVERRQLMLAGQFGRQPIGQAVGAEARQRLLAELAQALLGQALGGRVDRRQGLFHGDRFATAEGAVFRVVDLQAGGAGAHLAVAAHQGAAFQPLFLRLAEVVEAQRQGAAAIL